jgi:hypothetical protein
MENKKYKLELMDDERYSQLELVKQNQYKANVFKEEERKFVENVNVEFYDEDILTLNIYDADVDSIFNFLVNTKYIKLNHVIRHQKGLFDDGDIEYEETLFNNVYKVEHPIEGSSIRLHKFGAGRGKNLKEKSEIKD